MNIVNEQVTTYIEMLYYPLTPFLEELRDASEAGLVPIITRDAETFLLNILRIYRPSNILEIGTAVGYSAICFAEACPEAAITTLELRESSVEKARRNIEEAGCEERIEVLPGEAMETLRRLKPEVLSGERQPYDFIFIDAAKGQYREFWDLSLPLSAKEAVIISDNVLFKAMTVSDAFLDKRRNKTIARRMRDYLKYITAKREGITTSILPIGDGIAFTVKESE